MLRTPFLDTPSTFAQYVRIEHLLEFRVVGKGGLESDIRIGVLVLGDVPQAVQRSPAVIVEVRGRGNGVGFELLVAAAAYAHALRYLGLLRPGAAVHMRVSGHGRHGEIMLHQPMCAWRSRADR